MKKRNGFVIFLLVSCAAHMLFFTGTYVLSQLKPSPRVQSQKNKPIELIDIKELEKALTAQSPDDLKGKIVDQAESTNEKRPEKSDYLSRKNQTVERETKAAQKGKFQNVQPGAPTAPEKLQPVQAQAENTPKPKPTEKSEATNEPLDEKNTAQESPLDVADDRPINPGDVPLAKLMPESRPKYQEWKEQAKMSAGGISQTDDYLNDVVVSGETLLNTKEFIYFTYYSHIKERLRQHWEPKIKGKVERLLRQGRQIASQKDRITNLLIVLDNNGKLVRVQLLGESGVTDLDDAAIEAFEAAAPFPNPPKGLVGADGTVKIRWNFVLEV